MKAFVEDQSRKLIAVRETFKHYTRATDFDELIHQVQALPTADVTTSLTERFADYARNSSLETM